jgi:hypothetical protein
VNRLVDGDKLRLHFNRHGAAPLVWCVTILDGSGAPCLELAVKGFFVFGVAFQSVYRPKATADEDAKRPGVDRNSQQQLGRHQALAEHRRRQVMTLFHLFFWLALLYTFVALKGGLSNIAPAREYKSGTGWCVWRWTKVDSEYILRLHVVKTPWFAVCLHWIRKPDAEPWLHDHPVSFLSVILRGKYAELRQREGETGPRLLVHTWFNFIRATEHDKHRIVFTRKNTLTLCFMGSKTREWGFHTTWHGWLMWKDYYAKKRAEEQPNDKSTDFNFRKELDERLEKLSEDFISKYSGARLFIDEDKRLIDVRPVAGPEFDDEAPTEPRS